MTKKKRLRQTIVRFCSTCCRPFPAKRRDADTCSPRCRQRKRRLNIRKAAAKGIVLDSTQITIPIRFELAHAGVTIAAR